MKAIVLLAFVVALAFAEPEPNCQNDLACVYKTTTNFGAGCSWLQLPSPTNYIWRNPTSSICSEPVDPTSNGGIASISYNSSAASGHVSYFVTGTGKLVYQTNGWTGQQSAIGQLPGGHSFIIGLRQTGNTLVLITIAEAWEAPLNPLPLQWVKSFDPTTLGMGLAPNSRVTWGSDPNIYYYTGGFLAATIYTFRRFPPAIDEYVLDNFDDLPLSILYNSQRGTLVLTDPNNMLYEVNLATEDGPQPILAQPQGAHATVTYDALYYSANDTTIQITNLSSKKIQSCTPFKGQYVLGNFVFMSSTNP